MAYTGLVKAVDQVLELAAENAWDDYGYLAQIDIRDSILSRMVDQYSEYYEGHQKRFDRDRARAKITIANQTDSFFDRIVERMLKENERKI